MSEDLCFEKVLEVLKNIHKEFPDLRFGLVIQSAMDRYAATPNMNLHDRNSKQILDALTDFQRETQVRRKTK